LEGPLYWLRHGSLNGIWLTRPGMTFLLTPIISLFGRNPWGVKVFLHLLAFACVPLAYRIGWQLTRQQKFAFLTGIMAALTPDLFLYSNFLMSEVPNVFFGLLFCTFLLSALETFSWRWLIATMLAGAFSALLRSENIALLFIGVVFLFAKAMYDLRTKGNTGPFHQFLILKIPDNLWRLGLTILLAVLPIIGWSANNYRLYGYFGMTSNYSAGILYDGWIYFGDASNFSILDPDSPSVRILLKAHRATSDDPRLPPILAMHAALVKQGYSSEQAFSIMGDAAEDSIIKNPQRSLELLFIKIREGFTPDIQAAVTFHLADEPAQTRSINPLYFDDDNIAIPALIHLQRNVYQFFERYYQYIYPLWIWVCIGAMFFPQIIGLSNWRYAISGIVLVQIFGLAVLASLIAYMVFAVKYYTKKTTT
jgi:hypothetical protein